MKPIVFLFSLMILFSLSCKNDDDTSVDTIAGTWTLESASDNSSLDCTGTTILEFVKGQNDLFEVTIQSFEFMKDGDNNPVCNDLSRGDIYMTGTIDSITFKRTDNNNFIPPPKNQFNYTRNGNKLTLKTTNTNIGEVIYVYNRN